MISDVYFDPMAPLSVPVRYVHDECSKGKGAALIVTRTPSGWIYLCHRCHEQGFKPIAGLSPDQTRKLIEQGRMESEKPPQEPYLPFDFTNELPALALVWLYSYGISDAQIQEYNIGYSPYMGRVILPVYEDGKLVYWQGRAMRPGQKQKYLNMKQPRNSNPGKGIYFRVTKGRDQVVIVEDILSAIRVGEVADTVGLLYSHITDDLAHELSAKYKQCFIWLDYDKRQEAIRFYQRFKGLFGLDFKVVISPKDPKCYNRRKIEEYIHE